MKPNSRSEIIVLSLALLVTLPVLLGISVAGLLGARVGWPGLWLVVIAATCIAVLVWGLQAPTGTPAMQRFGAAFAVYAPAFLLGTLIFTAMGLSTLTLGRVTLVAVVVAGANIFLAQIFFTMGCAANLWECP